MERIGLHGCAAITARGAQVIQPLEVAALALPVADGVLHEVQLRNVAEVRDREYRLEHRLQTAVIAFARQRIHLQKTVVGTLLHLSLIHISEPTRRTPISYAVF